MTAHPARSRGIALRTTRILGTLGCVALCLLGVTLFAQDESEGSRTGAAFNLASSQIFTTKGTPAVDLTFQQLDHLDFRVYRVKDAPKFFAGLKDPHQLGSAEPVVPQERTLLERIALWKGERRAELRSFLRRQVSPVYRAERRKRTDQSEVKQRVALNKNAFAQVPLLNDAQLVTSWREILPNVRDAEYRRVPLDLPGPGVYLVEAVLPPHQAYTIVIVSDVGLVTKAAPGQALLFTANRFTGAPLTNCATHMLVDQQVAFTGQTAADGTAAGTIASQKPEDVIAMAQCGNDIVVTDPSAYALRSSPRDLLGYIYTDKPIYRPGHTVKFKGVLRWRERDAIVPFDQPQAEVSISDPEDKVLLRQTLKVDAFGAVSTSFVVPDPGALGYYWIKIQVGDETATASFEVQEYRKPEFEVIVTAAEKMMVQGGQAKLSLKAKYYYGQPVARGQVKYAIYKSGYYSPYRWGDSGEEYEYADDYFYVNEQIGEETVRLNDQGEATVPLDLPVDERRADYTLRIDARVTDASGREVSGKGSVIATHGDFMLSTTLDRYVYQPGSPAELRVRAVDYKGQPRAGVAVTVALDRMDYHNYTGGEPTATPVSNATVTTDAAGQAVWKTAFAKDAGSYRFRAEAPSAGRTVQAESRAWISGADRESDENAYDRYLELVADQKSYAPGQTAHLLLRGADLDATMLVTKEGQGITWHNVQEVKAGATIDVPIADADIGDTWVNIIFLKDDRVYRAERRLRVPETSRALKVSITAAQEVAKPRDPGVFTIRTTDQTGAPVSAQVSLAVVDEAVFAVKPDGTDDPVRFFFRRSYSRVNTSFSREYAFYGYSTTMKIMLAGAGGRRKPFTLADFKSDKESRPHVRKEFPDAIFWQPDIVTDATGTATVKVQYPDALTTWRLTARAVAADTRAGSAISRTTVTKDVILRLITPRFLTEGDTLRLPSIAHNYLPESKAMTVSVSATGLTPVDASATTPRTAEIASGGESRMEWPFKAQQVGTATVTGTATTPGDGDAVELPVPVLPYGLKREVGQSGAIAGGGDRTIEVTIPEQSNPAARSIQISLAPSLAGSILSALDFLADYPYGCTEQTVSSFFPNLIVMRALTELKMAPTERLRRLDRMSADGVKRLYDLQHDDGGWGWWKTDANHPFMTAYALWALVEAQKAGVPVEGSRIGSAYTAARKVYAQYPKMIPELKIYMLYVLGQAKALAPQDTSDTTDVAFDAKAALDEVWAARDRMGAYGQVLLLLTLDAAKDPRGNTLAPVVVAAAKTQGDLSWWPTDNDPLLEDWDDTTVESTAFAIKALAPRMPNDPLIERAARYLLVNRRGGYFWSSTKQTAFALMGLLEHLKARGDKPSTMTVDVEVNGTKVGAHTFTPESWTAANPTVFTAPGQAGVNKVRLVARNGGSAYWTATARYYDNRESLEQTGTRKLALSRKYFALTPVTVKGKILYRESPFTGTAKAGDLLLVRLVAAGASDWRYIMLEDPLPAGAEAIREPELYQLEKPIPWWYGSQREYRDNRIVQFQTSFEDGRYEYSYLLKVVTPGTFKAMPAQVTPMYVPGVFATTGTQQMEVPSAVETAPAPPPVEGQQKGGAR